MEKAAGRVSGDVWPVTELVGREIRNHHDEELGRVEEILLDVRGGMVAYLAIAFEGGLGRRGKLFAVPWEAITFSHDNRLLHLDVERDWLEQQEGLERGRWPVTPDYVEWTRQAYAAQGYPDPPPDGPPTPEAAALNDNRLADKGDFHEAQVRNRERGHGPNNYPGSQDVDDAH